MNPTRITLALLLLFTLAACTKTRYCHCIWDAGTSGGNIRHPLQDMSRSEAQDTCSAYLTAYQAVDPNATCELE